LWRVSNVLKRLLGFRREKAMAGVHGGSPDLPDRDEAVLIKLHHLGSVLQAQRVRRELDALIADGNRHIILDVTDLDYTGSVAAAAVIAGYAKHAPLGVRIGIVADEPAVGETLAHNGCAEWLDVYLTADEALTGCDAVVTTDADYQSAEGTWRTSKTMTVGK